MCVCVGFLCVAVCGEEGISFGAFCGIKLTPERRARGEGGVGEGEEER